MPAILSILNVWVHVLDIGQTNKCSSSDEGAVAGLPSFRLLKYDHAFFLSVSPLLFFFPNSRCTYLKSIVNQLLCS